MRHVHKDIGRNRTDKPSLPCGQDSQGRDENISAYVCEPRQAAGLDTRVDQAVIRRREMVVQLSD